MSTTTTTRPAAGGRQASGRHRTGQQPVARHRLARSGTAGWQRFLGVAWAVVAVAGTLAGTCAVVLAAATRLSPLGQFTAFGHPVLVASSDAMSPVIRKGDLIVDDAVTPEAATRLRIGQVVSFRTFPGSPRIVTREITGIATSRGAVRYYTDGDARSAAGPATWPSADVAGVVRFSVTDGGYLLTAVHQPLVLGLLVGSPLLWLLASPIYQLSAAGIRGRSPRSGR